jgi:hypothetical protein
MVQHLHPLVINNFELPEGAKAMSKRSRRTKDKDNARPAENRAPEAAPSAEARPSDHGHVELKLVVSGAAFQTFDAWIDTQLEDLVGRWIHAAAPAANLVRRLVPEVKQNELTESGESGI